MYINLYILGLIFLLAACAKSPVEPAYNHARYGTVPQSHAAFQSVRDSCGESYFRSPKKMGVFTIHTHQRAEELMNLGRKADIERNSYTVDGWSNIFYSDGTFLPIPTQVTRVRARTDAELAKVVYVSEEFDAAYNEMNYRIEQCVRDKGWFQVIQ